MPAEGELHGHKCGWSPTFSPEWHGRGCGHVFIHRNDQSVSTDRYAQAHRCPACGSGPWQNVWFPGVEEMWNSMPPEEQAAMRAAAQLRKLLNSALIAIFIGDDDAE